MMDAVSRKGWNKTQRAKRRPRSMYIEYYVVPFAKFHDDLSVNGFSHGLHIARSEFWSLIPPGQYTSEQGRDLVLAYLNSVEGRLAAILSANSISYYLHVYRRLAPYSIGADKRGMTVALVRATFEAAIQKYASPGLCGRIAVSTEVSPDAILRGFLFRDQRLGGFWADLQATSACVDRIWHTGARGILFGRKAGV
jgi:hypothetical protein